MTSSVFQTQKGDDERTHAPRVAVVAVHGVGTHQPRESAFSIADLLVNKRAAPTTNGHPESGTALYTPFEESHLHIAVRPVVVENKSPEKCEADPLDVRFMAGQLRDYQTDPGAPEENIYETVCFKGRRLPQQENQCPTVEVHVFEAFWDDLSRLDSNFGHLVTTFFELLCEVSWLGYRTIQSVQHGLQIEITQRKAVQSSVWDKEARKQSKYFAARKSPSWDTADSAWSRYFSTYKIASWLLSVAIPLLNLWIFGILLTIPIATLSASYREFVALLVLALLALGGAYLFLFKRPHTFWHWTILPFSGILLLGLLAHFLFGGWWYRFMVHHHVVDAYLWPAWSGVLAAQWLLIYTAGLGWLMSRYEKRRPGAWHAFIVISLLVLLALVLVSLVRVSMQVGLIEHSLIQTAIRVVDGLHIVLKWTWVIIIGAGIQAFWESNRAINTLRKLEEMAEFEDDKEEDARQESEKEMWRNAVERACRAAFTARLAFSISTALTLLASTVAYGITFSSINWLAPFLSQISYYPLRVLGLSSHSSDLTPSAADFLWNLVIRSSGSSMVVLLLLFAFALLLLLWGFLPVALADAVPLKPLVPDDELNLKSEQYGRWLDNGYRVARLGGELIFLGIILLLPCGFIADSMSGYYVGETSVLTWCVASLQQMNYVGEISPDAQQRWLAGLLIFPMTLVFSWIYIKLAAAELKPLVTTAGDTEPELALIEKIFRLPLVALFAIPFVIFYPIFYKIGHNDALLLTLVNSVAGSAVGLAALSVRLESVALGFRPVLDVILDVERHLRNMPHDKTPRALMTARYASLLRYLCHASPQADNVSWGYDAIIIVAHSQGSVLSADLLRFLQRHHDESLAKLSTATDVAQRGFGRRCHPECPIPIVLFTMGCPLRQLYGLRFPDLYGWARHTETDAPQWANYHQERPYDLSEPIPNPLELAGSSGLAKCVSEWRLHRSQSVAFGYLRLQMARLTKSFPIA